MEGETLTTEDFYESTSETAFAKINLSLRVTGRRDDGYHTLESFVVFAETGDFLTWTPGFGGRFHFGITGPFSAELSALPTEKNLVWRAASLFQEITGRSLQGTLTLDKRLPLASGIGGGSADAAAALRLFHRYYRPSVSLEEVAQHALRLGADVPMCLYATSGWVTGIGEHLQPYPLPRDFPRHLVLLNPGVGLPTPNVFQERQGPFSNTLQTNDLFWEKFLAVEPHCRCLPNDLLVPAKSLCPEIGDLLSLLEQQPGARWTGMSGSGATCFGVFDDASQAALACSSIKERVGSYNPSSQSLWIHQTKIP